ncbi:hypothetical protein JCGZ_08306 [Jatropha curcas]|uniref:Uncharacterized protein n=1 Tax=Jatropha curcas TaxID=180498 RepID=A0A067KYX5_JATCU|nr:hypothetical protein JCGZ_08306 [Jatropha curcas]
MGPSLMEQTQTHITELNSKGTELIVYKFMVSHKSLIAAAVGSHQLVMGKAGDGIVTSKEVSNIIILLDPIGGLATDPPTLSLCMEDSYHPLRWGWVMRADLGLTLVGMATLSWLTKFGSLGLSVSFSPTLLSFMDKFSIFV